MKTEIAALSSLALAIGLLSAAADAQDHQMIKPGDLKWTDVPSLPPGAKLTVIEGKLSETQPFTFRLKFPPNYKVPAHWHPAVERVTVISGTFHMGTGDKLDTSKTMALAPGSVAIMQPK